MKKKLVPFYAAVFFMIIIFVFLYTKPIKAESNRTKIAVSVFIERDDTIWSIAQTYYSDEFGTMEKYMKEIKKTNSLTSDKIHAGHYLIVPYYK